MVIKFGGLAPINMLNSVGIFKKVMVMPYINFNAHGRNLADYNGLATRYTKFHII